MAQSKEEGSEKRSARRKMGEGIRQGIGVLSAFKDALEETIQEARERGDLSADRAKAVMKGALERAQAAASDARERLDFVNHGDLEALEVAMDDLKERVAALEGHVFGAPVGGAEAPRSGKNGDDAEENGDAP